MEDDEEEEKKEQHELESVVDGDVGTSPPHHQPARMSDGNMTMASSRNNTVVTVERRSSAK